MNNSSALPPTVACPHQVLWCEESFRSNIRFSALAGAVSFTVTGLTAVLSNALLFVVYYLNEPLRRRPANTILLALALMDFLTGTVVNSLSVSEQVIILTADCTHICVVQELKFSCTIFFTTATLVTLSLSTLDRYVAVFHSFRYAELVTNERVTKVLLALWLGLVVNFATSRVLIRNQLISFALCVSNVIFIAVLYYKIYKEIRRLESHPVVAANEVENARKERERKTAKTVGLVLGFLFLSYVPLILFLVFRMVSETFLHRETTDLLTQKLRLIVSVSLLSNSTVNAFVYFWTMSEFREAISKLFRPITTRFSNDVAPA